MNEWDLMLKFPKDQEENVEAKISIDTRYLNSTIYIYPSVKAHFDKGRGKDIMEIILHEMCHIITEPFYDFTIPRIAKIEQESLEDIRERQTQRITRSILPLIPKSIYTIKNVPTKKKKSRRVSVR